MNFFVRIYAEYSENPAKERFALAVRHFPESGRNDISEDFTPRDQMLKKKNKKLAK